MKIALYHNLLSGGARRAMVEMVKELVLRNHIIDEYCPQSADLSLMSLEGHVRRTVVLPNEISGIARKRIPFLTPYMTAIRLLGDLRSIATVGKQAAQCIDQQNYDLVFTHDCHIVLVPDVLRFARRPGIHYFHVGVRGLGEGQSTRHLDQERLTRLKRVYYAPARKLFTAFRFRIARRNLHSAQCVLTNSSFAAAELRDTFGVAPQVCRLGVNGTCFRPLNIPREPFVLSVGAVHYHKGYRFLLHALARLPESERLPLVIAANSVELSELQTLQLLAARLGVSFQLLRISDEAEMARLYNRAAAFVYSPICEPWGLAAVEAMACGAPVVAVAEGGIVESVVDGETGFLVQRSPEKFAQALGRVLADPALARRLGAAGVDRAHTQFTWQSTVDRLENIFQEMVR